MTQGDCAGRVTAADIDAAQKKERGGYRQFIDMTESSASQDPFLGNTPLVSFKDVFNIQARDNATMYFAMRYCKAGIPAPMRFEVTVTPQPFPNVTKDGISLPPMPVPWAGVCLASALQDNKQGSNQALKSVKCESDVGERGLEALVINARVMCMLMYCRSELPASRQQASPFITNHCCPYNCCPNNSSASTHISSCRNCYSRVFLAIRHR